MMATLLRRLLGITVALLATAVSLRACPFCLGLYMKEPTLADDVLVARDVVLAQAGREAGALVVKSVVKGDAALSGFSVTLPEAKGDSLFLLTRRDDAGGWKLQGKSAVSLAAFLTSIIKLPANATTDAEWVSRLTAMRPFIAHSDPRIARSAWVMWAEAPYKILKDEAHQFRRAELRQWLADPAMAGQNSLWLVLLGLQGNDEDAAWLAGQVEAAWKAGDDQQLSTLLVAFTARRGIEAVDFIEQHYLRDRNRTLEEIQAALAALSLHGREGTADMRQRVVEAYRVFMAERKPLAGLVARDLAEWQQWEFAPAFEALLKSAEPIHPTARMAMIEYLRARPVANR